MKLIFVQSQSAPFGILSSIGISRCYVKHLFPYKDQKLITGKSHHHTGFEIHMIENGSQTYELDNKKIKIESGEFLLIPPLVNHIITETSSQTNKYSITFSVTSDSSIFKDIKKPFHCKLPDSVYDNLEMIVQESQKKHDFYNRIIENRILECIYLLLRSFGIADTENNTQKQTEDHRFSLAVQYVSDNICNWLTVKEIADYCALSVRQLSRVFEREMGISTSEYIRKERYRYIENLLADPKFTLRQISEIMNFDNEYYFNTFFKKCAGMTPGAYRKTINIV